MCTHSLNPRLKLPLNKRRESWCMTWYMSSSKRKDTAVRKQNIIVDVEIKYDLEKNDFSHRREPDCKDLKDDMEVELIRH
jgi:hypothetical protein